MGYPKLITLLLGGAVLVGLPACRREPPCCEHRCDPTLEGDPDCLLDGECDITDPRDPDCNFCDYPENAEHEDCVPDPCDEPNPPPECNPFVPDRISVDFTLAYDSETNTGRPFFVDDSEIPPTLSVLIQDAKFASTNNTAFACNIELSSIPGYNPIGAANRFDVAEPKQTLDHYGVVWAQANYTFTDAPFESTSGTIEGCSSKYLDPAVYGDDVTALLSDRDWGAGWGPIETQIEAFMNDPTADDPADDYDLYDLHQDGYLCGGSQLVGENTTGYLISYAFEVDPVTWTQVPSDNNDDPYERLPCSAMEADGETGRPASGIYLSRSYGYWNAPFLLGLQ